MATTFEIMKERAKLRARGIDPDAPSELEAASPSMPSKSRRQQLREASRRHYLKHHYNITPEMYDNQLKEQGGACAICEEKPTNRPLAVDHSHLTGALRSLLCARCNMAIGLMFENPKVLASAIEYVRYWHERDKEQIDDSSDDKADIESFLIE